jgi:hypothetical protein
MSQRMHVIGSGAGHASRRVAVPKCCAMPPTPATVAALLPARSR